MDNFNIGNLIFWLITLGFLVGSIGKVFFGKKGRHTASNIFGAGIVSVIAGVIAGLFGINGEIAFGVMGASAFVILFNVFCLLESSHTGENEGVRRI